MASEPTAGATLAARLLPPPRGEYRGSLLAAHFLALLGVFTILPGCIHSFLPDGGAGTIAGLDLEACGAIITALFAWAGATQIAFGVVMLLAGVRYRTFVPAVLALVLLERGLHFANAWVVPRAPGHHHPPEHYFVLIGVPLLVVALLLSLRGRRSGQGAREEA